VAASRQARDSVLSATEELGVAVRDGADEVVFVAFTACSGRGKAPLAFVTII